MYSNSDTFSIIEDVIDTVTTGDVNMDTIDDGRTGVDSDEMDFITTSYVNEYKSEGSSDDTIDVDEEEFEAEDKSYKKAKTEEGEEMIEVDDDDFGESSKDDTIDVDDELTENGDDMVEIDDKDLDIESSKEDIDVDDDDIIEGGKNDSDMVEVDDKDLDIESSKDDTIDVDDELTENGDDMVDVDIPSNDDVVKEASKDDSIDVDDDDIIEGGKDDSDMIEVDDKDLDLDDDDFGESVDINDGPDLIEVNDSELEGVKEDLDDMTDDVIDVDDTIEAHGEGNSPKTSSSTSSNDFDLSPLDHTNSIIEDVNHEIPNGVQDDIPTDDRINKDGRSTDDLIAMDDIDDIIMDNPNNDSNLPMYISPSEEEEIVDLVNTTLINVDNDLLEAPHFKNTKTVIGKDAKKSRIIGAYIAAIASKKNDKQFILLRKLNAKRKAIKEILYAKYLPMARSLYQKYKPDEE